MSKTVLPDERATRAIGLLKDLQSYQDIERAHIDADEVLCNLLRELNFDDVVEEWLKVDRWYS